MPQLITVDEARSKIAEHLPFPGTETIFLDDAFGRYLAEPIKASLSSAPFKASAMDGYAVCFSDMKSGNHLTIIDEAAAGSPSDKTVLKGTAIRIFTGAEMPEGADHVIIQEDVERNGDQITITEPQTAPANIRNAGLDFKKNEQLFDKGHCISAIDMALIASANHARISVVKQPKIAIFANGDELKSPGSSLKRGEIIASNHYAIQNLCTQWGAKADYLGLLPDNQQAIEEVFNNARSYDLIIPIGGASVGDYDYVKSALSATGGEIIFSKIAVKPGKPCWFGALGDAHILGLPGNPSSAIVTAWLFLHHAVSCFLGKAAIHEKKHAILAGQLAANGGRETYLRAFLDDQNQATPFANQDSSLLSPLTKANILIKRPVGDAARHKGDEIEIIAFG